ncbi:hypothetical protein E2C01_044760 [Portunus trituberculatus]|uniref:Uncharacterized protein n=1 Tax=Portunus trituberculatus TaxID=210409 RepID=A0A5B7G021_PORTR|nr:hypothetical protein [Portunus trituberculatus]
MHTMPDTITSVMDSAQRQISDTGAAVTPKENQYNTSLCLPIKRQNGSSISTVGGPGEGLEQKDKIQTNMRL